MAPSKIEVELAIKDFATDEIIRFARTVEFQGGKIEKGTKKASDGIDKTTRAAKGLETEARKLDRELDRASAGLDEVGKEAKEARAGLDSTKAGASELRGAFGGLKAAAAALGLGAAVSAGAAFSRSIGEVATIADGSAAEIAGLRTEVLELSRELGLAPVDTAQALYQTISAGATEAADATLVLNAGLRLSVGGISSPTAAIDGLTTVLNAYKLETSEVSRVSDAFFSTVRLGKTRIEELAGSIGKVAPLASQLGVSYEELLAALAALTKQGLSTSEAFTQIQSVLVGLTKNTDDIDKALQSVGSSFGDGEIRARGLAAVLNDVRRVTGDSESELVKLFGRVEAVGGVLGLTGANAEEFASILGQVKTGAGATSDALATISDTTGQKLTILFQNLKTFAAEAGEELAKFAFDVAEAFEESFGTSKAEADATTAAIERLTSGLAGSAQSARALLEDQSVLNGTLAVLAGNADASANELRKLKSDLDLLVQADGTVRVGIQVDDAALDELSSALGEDARSLTVEVPVDAGFEVAQFQVVADAIESTLGNGLSAGLSPERYESLINRLIELNGPIEEQFQAVAEDGSKVIVERFRLAAEDGRNQIQAVLKELDAPVSIPIRLNVDEESSQSVPLPGADSEDLRLFVPVEYQADTAQFEALGKAVKAALDAGVIDFSSGETFQSLPADLSSLFDDVDEELSGVLEDAFFSTPFLEVTEAATGAARGIKEFEIAYVDGVRILSPVIGGLREQVQALSGEFARTPSFPLIELTSDGVRATDAYAATIKGLQAAVKEGTLSQEEYAKRLGDVQARVERANASAIAALQAGDRQRALVAQLGTAEEQRSKALEAAYLRQAAAVAKAVADSKISVAQAQVELELIEKIRDQRRADLQAAQEAADSAPPYVSERDLERLQSARERATALRDAFVQLGISVAQTAVDLEAAASESRIDQFDLDLASAYEIEIAKVQEVVDRRLKVIRDNVKAGILLPEQAATEVAAVQATAEALRDQADASQEIRVAQELATTAGLESQAAYAELAGGAQNYTEALGAELEALGLELEAQRLSIQAKVDAGEVSQESADRQVEALDRVRAAAAAATEAEIERRAALEGDDVFAGFAVQAEEELKRFRGGAVGAEIASDLFGTLESAADAFGQSLANAGQGWAQFREQAVSNLSAIILKALFLKAIQETLGAFGFGGGGVGIGGAVTSAVTGGGGGGAPGGFRQSYSFDPEYQASRFSPLGAMPSIDDGLDFGNVTAFAKGGVMPGRFLGSVPLGPGGTDIPHRAYSGGGIARSPQLALFGEVPGVAEAFVPLPDGKNIPVKLEGGRFQEGLGAINSAAVNAQITLTVNALDPSSATEAILSNMDAIQNELKSAVEKGTDRGLAVTMGNGRGRRR